MNKFILLIPLAMVPFGVRCENHSYRTNAVYRIEAGPDWLPFFNDREIVAGSALDLTQLGCLDAPAGKHGWLKAVDGHFEFEDSPGIVRRFFGANICGEAPYPETPKEACAFADRLTRLGYNAIRIHHYDNAISRVRDGHLELVPEMIDRLDRFLAECFKRGIYVTTDLYVSRRTPVRDIGVDRDGDVRKTDFMTTDWGFRNWCEFARMFLLHRNPHTGRTYAEEPAMPFIALINEASFHGSNANKWLATGRLDDKWREWLTEERKRSPSCFPGYETNEVPRKGMAWWPQKREAAMMSAFYAWVEKDFDRRATRFLRDELGVKALLTGQNNGPVNAIVHQLRCETCDYVDAHHYVDHPAGFKCPLLIKNVNEALEPFPGYAQLAWDRDWTLPYVISEYDYCSPNTSRAQNGPMIGAMAALQGWSAMWRFDYAGERYTFSPALQVPWLFSAITDPLQLASDRATVFLFLRGDLEPLPTKLAIDYDDRALDKTQGRTWGCPRDGGDVAWRVQVGTSVGGRLPPDVASFEAVDYPTNRTVVFAAVKAGRSPITVDHSRGLFAFESPRCCGGSALRGKIEAGALTAELALAPAVVWAGSLDGQPLDRSRRILLNHLTDVQADGTEFADPTQTLMLNRGKRKRSVMRRGYAKVSLTRKLPDQCRVWALDTAGRRIEEVPCKLGEGGLEIVLDTLGDTCTRMLYEVIVP